MKSSIHVLAALAGLCLLTASPAQAGRPDSPGGGPPACDAAAISAAAAAIAATCPCDGQTDDAGDVVPWTNHGQYVRCVARATKAAVKGSDGGLRRRCVKESVRCAARSTCGREGAVNCTTATTSACVAGLCDDGSACTTDDDCTESSCSFRQSAAECSADGGLPGVGSCCSPTPIGSPSGAFIDGPQLF